MDVDYDNFGMYTIYYGNDIVDSIKTKFSKEEEENE